MKFYDKELFKASNSIKAAIYMIIIFSLGFIVGYFTFSMEKNRNLTNVSQDTIVDSRNIESTQL